MLWGLNNLSQKKPETKPFTNFSVFHDSLITRLKSLSQIQDNFEKRHKDLETKYTDKFSDLRKQLDNRWKQIDKFEASVKSLAEVKQSWKRKFAQKEGELDAVKSTNSELTTQLSSMKRPGQAESLEIKALQARATNAERRLTNAQNQLAATEEKVASMNQKTTIADNKWEARVKEYEARIKAAEERVKRERQGAKERVAELETNIKCVSSITLAFSLISLESCYNRIGHCNAKLTLLTKGTHNLMKYLRLLKGLLLNLSVTLTYELCDYILPSIVVFLPRAFTAHRLSCIS